MRVNNEVRVRFWTVLGVLLLLAGCQQDVTKSQSKQAVTKQWNGARASVLAGLARDQYRGQNFNECRKTLDEALKLDPTNANLWVLLGRLNIEQSQLEPAQIALDKARQADPVNAEADYLSGVIYQRWQKLQEAYDYYDRAASKAPGELSYLMAKAEMLVALDRRDEALNLLTDRLSYFEHSPYIRDAVGQLLVHKGQYREAAQVLREASILAGDDLQIREHLGLALFYGKQHREAGDVLNSILKDPSYQKRADLHTALGACQSEIGRLREARESFETAARLDPASTTAWLNLGKVALQMNDIQRAELSVRKAISLDAASSEAYLLTGYVRIRQDRMNEALTAFKQASALADKDPVSLCMIGYVLEKTGKSDQAIGFYARALKLDPKDELATKLMAGVNPGE